jgi:hypothetical protein
MRALGIAIWLGCAGGAWAADVPAAGVPDLPGFTALGPSQRHDAQGLFRVIDGGAELYLAYGFRELQLRDFQKGEVKLSVFIYDLGRPLAAFGLARREWPRGGEALGLGPESLASPPQQCLLRKGRYYLKVEPLQGKLDAGLCREVLAPLHAALPGEDGAPAELGLLPAADQVAGSAGYTRQSYLGLAALGEAVHAEYAAPGGGALQAFLLLPTPERPVEAAWAELQKRWRPVPGGGLVALGRKVPYRGPVLVTRTPRGVCGVALDGAEELDPAAWAQGMAALTALHAHLSR